MVYATHSPHSLSRLQERNTRRPVETRGFGAVCVCPRHHISDNADARSRTQAHYHTKKSPHDKIAFAATASARRNVQCSPLQPVHVLRTHVLATVTVVPNCAEKTFCTLSPPHALPHTIGGMIVRAAMGLTGTRMNRDSGTCEGVKGAEGLVAGRWVFDVLGVYDQLAAAREFISLIRWLPSSTVRAMVSRIWLSSPAARSHRF